MRGNISIIILMALSSVCARLYGQTTTAWQTLAAAPVVSRHNDVYFVTSTLGWLVNGRGQIYKTTDGGTSWQKQFDQSATHFRSVGFVDSLHGWAGNVGLGEFGTTDSTVLYQTTNGGSSWTPVDSLNGPQPPGLCGMYVVNDSVICAVGRVRGPSFFVKTTDRGKTWFSKAMNAYAAGLVDVYFTHPDTGFGVGLTNVDHTFSSGVVLFTSDGGETWEERFTTNRIGEWCWKISFPSPNVGYVSLQRNSLTPIFFLKTSDGGKTWEEKLFSNSYYFVQGIGFVTELIGWIGGNSTFPTFQTTDGGETWQSANFGARVNRFRFLNDTLGYAVGRTVYKYSTTAPVHVASNEKETLLYFNLKQNYPNPFNPSTTIEFGLQTSVHVTLAIFNLLGQKVVTLINEWLAPGSYKTVFDAADFPSGIYYYTLEAGLFKTTKKMVLIK